MTPKTTSSSTVCFPTSDVVFATQMLQAAAGLIHEVHKEHEHTGRLPVGAMLHVATIIDGVIDRMELDRLVLEQANLPF